MSKKKAKKEFDCVAFKRQVQGVRLPALARLDGKIMHPDEATTGARIT